MKSVIIFESLHGSTEKCAKLLAGKVNSDIELARLQDKKDLDIEKYDTIIIGGSIHHGMIHSRIEKFIHNNHSILMSKNVGFYLCCMEEGEVAKKQFETAYPEDLRRKAFAKGLFGGEFNFGKMNFFEKKMTQKITGINSSVSKINLEEIDKFAAKVNDLSK
ncbi:MAG: flavodoxin domain-containing protein [Bacteroidales bacterium]|nr:flavodoxin domain-containing protein [Bacteroidales bacterium]MCB8999094.1 flavodoxin domain-containing protein [Bacteroidales bacterium]